jgi:hypothetical protein
MSHRAERATERTDVVGLMVAGASDIGATLAKDPGIVKATFRI